LAPESWFKQEAEHIKLIQDTELSLRDKSPAAFKLHAFYDARGLEIQRLTKLRPPDYLSVRALTQDEWCFESVENEDCQECLEYEMSREVSLWRTMVYNYRQVDQHRPDSVLNLILFFSHLLELKSYPDWPTKPWSAQKHRRQKSPVSDYTSLFADLDVLAGVEPSLQQRAELRVKYGRPLLHSYLQIDLSQPTALLERQFSSWLKSQRKLHPVKIIETRGTNSAKATLRALGVYRLLRVVSQPKAQIFLQEKGIDEYRRDSSLIHAADRAKFAIARFALANVPPRDPTIVTRLNSKGAVG